MDSYITVKSADLMNVRTGDIVASVEAGHGRVAILRQSELVKAINIVGEALHSDKESAIRYADRINSNVRIY